MGIQQKVSILTALALCLALTNAGNAQFDKPTPELIDKDLKALKAGGNGRTFALRRLCKYEGPLAEKQEEVAGVLMKLVKDTKSYDAMRALAIWATPAELKSVPEYLANDDLTKAALYVLGQKKVADQSKAVAAYLSSGGGRDKEAMDALIAIGPDAEDAVLPYAEPSKPKHEKHLAIRVLTVIGTKKSLDPLRVILEDKKDNGGATLAKTAIARIEGRSKDGKDK